MSTNDAPGAVAANGDDLHVGCWAEHNDGSLIFVYSTENDRVVFTMFDVAEKPPTEYRTAMPRGDFEKEFSWNVTDAKRKEKWTWHDKTPFPMDRVMNLGAKPGARFASADALLSAAGQVARSIGLRGVKSRVQANRPEGWDGMSPREKATWMIEHMQELLNELPE